MKTKQIISAKKMSLVLLSSSLVLFILSFTFNKSDVEKIKLEDALAKKMISCSFKSTGTYQGKSIAAELKSFSKKVTIVIPAGTYFKASSEEEQDLIIVEDVFVQVNPSAKTTKVLDGFCCKASNRCPKKDGKFQLVPNKIEKFDEFSKLIKGKSFSPSTIQDAVWVMSDKRPIANISGENKDLVKGFRENLAKLTGLKNEWYEAPQIRQVDPFGNINRETVAIQGNIEFDNKTIANVHQEVQDKDGNMKMRTNNTYRLDPGKVSYFFKLQVTGWEKGKYFVKLMNGTKVLNVREFEV